ncbi:MAG: hypothetical protein NT018_07740 [Armatimonadetes bacterium]|nr:hypothetical protein [Armatimonadota bacterium]
MTETFSIDRRAGRVWVTLIWVVAALLAVVFIVGRMRTPKADHGRSRLDYAAIAKLSASEKSAPKVSFDDPYEGFEIIPGEYMISWAIKDPKYENSYMSTEKLAPKTRQQVIGNLSKSARSCNEYGFTIIIDESQGPGGGFDIAYAFPDRLLQKGRKASLAKAYRLPLKKDEQDKQVSERMPIELQFGSGSHLFTRPADIYVKTNSYSPGNVGVAFVLRGGLYGNIQTTDGIYIVEVTDQDRDGNFDPVKYNRYLCKSCGTYHESEDVDSFSINGLKTSSGMSSYFNDGSGMKSGVNMVAGKLYDMQMSPKGDMLRVKPYTGVAGAVDIRANDGFGKPAGFSMSFSSEKQRSFVVSGQGTRMAKLPPGKYRVNGQVGVLRADTANSNDDSNKSYTSVDCDMPSIEVKAGSNTVIEMGGPVSISFIPSGDIVVKHGVKRIVKTVIAMPHSKNIYFNSGYERKMFVTVTNTKGKVIKNLKATQYGSSLLNTFDAGTLEPGDYMISASHDFRVFSPKTQASAKIKVMP